MIEAEEKKTKVEISEAEPTVQPASWFTYNMFKRVLKLIYIIYYDSIIIKAIESIKKQQSTARIASYDYIIRLTLTEQFAHFEESIEVLVDFLASLQLAARADIAADQTIALQAAIIHQVLDAFNKHFPEKTLFNLRLLRFYAHHYPNLINTYCPREEATAKGSYAATSFTSAIIAAIDSPNGLKEELSIYKIEISRLKNYLRQYFSDDPLANDLISYFNFRSALSFFVESTANNISRRIRSIKSGEPLSVSALSKRAADEFAASQMEFRKNCPDDFANTFKRNISEYLQKNCAFLLALYDKLEGLKLALESLSLSPPIMIAARPVTKAPLPEKAPFAFFAQPKPIAMAPTAVSEVSTSRGLMAPPQQKELLSSIQDVLETMHSNLFNALAPEEMGEIFRLFSVTQQVYGIAVSMATAKTEVLARWNPVKTRLAELKDLFEQRTDKKITRSEKKEESIQLEQEKRHAPA